MLFRRVHRLLHLLIRPSPFLPFLLFLHFISRRLLGLPLGAIVFLFPPSRRPRRHRRLGHHFGRRLGFFGAAFLPSSSSSPSSSSWRSGRRFGGVLGAPSSSSSWRWRSRRHRHHLGVILVLVLRHPSTSSSSSPHPLRGAFRRRLAAFFAASSSSSP